MKLLIFDLETSPSLGYVWSMWKQNLYPDQIVQYGETISWAAKWLDGKKIFCDSVNKTSSDHMIQGIWDLMDQADAICHFNGCVAPGNRVLTKDLRWVDVATLKPGDELLAFNEYSPGKNQKRKYEVSTVLHSDPIVKECSKITFSDGTSIVASNDHPWLACVSECGSNHVYVPTDQLHGHPMFRVLPAWDEDSSYAAGYLSAFMDGEGCLTQQARAGRVPPQFMFSVSFSQKDKRIIAKLQGHLSDKGFKFSVRQYDKNHPDMAAIRVLGGFSEVMRFFGQIRPAKITRLDYDKLQCQSLHKCEQLTVESIEPVGPQTVIGLETTSKTYIVEGIPCHNSKFDIPTINREFVQTNRPPPSPSKEIDLYRVVKQNFKFPRNSLQSVCEFLGLDLKTDHKGFLLWKECLEGNQTAWNTMHRYNKQDVKITEQLYKRLLPWIRNHPNLSLYLDSSRPACPNCGGTEMEKRGLARTNTQQYQRYQCKGCGKWSRERFNCTPPEKKHTVLQGIHN